MKSVEALLQDIDRNDYEHIATPCTGVGVVAMRETVDLVAFGQALGLEPAPHDAAGNLLWDVQPRPERLDRARSHTDEEFTWHTDASFEAAPPRYFMLQVLHGDQFGGGQQRFLELDRILAEIGDEATQTLATVPLQWKVPREFDKGTPSRVLPTLFDTEDGRAIRYRQECMTLQSMPPRLRQAFQTLAACLVDLPPVTHTPRAGEILVVDNHHVLHARDRILDQNRHLQRVRFH